MTFFDATYKQIFLGKASNGVLLMATSGTTDLLTAGQVGIYSCPNGIEGSAISTGTATDCKIISGSWHTVDSIAQFWGGLKVSLKSRLIGWRNVTRFIKATAVAAQQEIDAWGWSQSSASTTGPLFNCGTPYFFRLDFIGDPVLRLLDHQGYVNLPAYGACCTTDCSSGCTSGYVDAASIMLQWKDFITGTQMPYLSSFVTPNVYIQNGASKTEVFSAQDTAAGRGNGTYSPNTSTPQTVVASFQLTGAYQETTFGTCTYTPTDYFNLQPIQMFGSLVTQNALPCATNTTINTSVPNMYTQLQAGVQARGLGYQLRNDLVLSQRYRQEQFPDSMYTKSLRMRGIEDDVVVPNVTATALYDYIGIEWNVTEGRNANPNGLSDRDDTSLMIAVPTGTTTTVLTNLISSCLTAAGSNVTLETM